MSFVEMFAFYDVYFTTTFLHKRQVYGVFGTL